MRRIIQGSSGAVGDIINIIITKTSNYTAISTDSIIECDTTSGAITITLPITFAIGEQIVISWIAGSNPCSISSISTIQNPTTGAFNTTVSIPSLGSNLSLYKSSTGWRII